MMAKAKYDDKISPISVSAETKEVAKRVANKLGLSLAGYVRGLLLKDIDKINNKEYVQN